MLHSNPLLKLSQLCSVQTLSISDSSLVFLYVKFRENKSLISVKLRYFHCFFSLFIFIFISYSMGLFNWTKIIFKKVIDVKYLKFINLLYYIKFGRTSVIILTNFLQYSQNYGNYSLLCILLLEVFCSTMWNLVEYKLLFPVAILWCILTVRHYISYDFHELLLIRIVYCWEQPLLL